MKCVWIVKSQKREVIWLEFSDALADYSELKQPGLIFTSLIPLEMYESLKDLTYETLKELREA